MSPAMDAMLAAMESQPAFSACSGLQPKVAGSWRVNLKKFLEQCQSAADNGFRFVPRRWTHALREWCGHTSQRRMQARAASRRTESLEIRQVLSTVTPLVTADLSEVTTDAKADPQNADKITVESQAFREPFAPAPSFSTPGDSGTNAAADSQGCLTTEWYSPGEAISLPESVTILTPIWRGNDPVTKLVETPSPGELPDTLVDQVFADGNSVLTLEGSPALTIVALDVDQHRVVLFSQEMMTTQELIDIQSSATSVEVSEPQNTLATEPVAFLPAAGRHRSMSQGFTKSSRKWLRFYDPAGELLIADLTAARDAVNETSALVNVPLISEGTHLTAQMWSWNSGRVVRDQTGWLSHMMSVSGDAFSLKSLQVHPAMNLPDALPEAVPVVNAEIAARREQEGGLRTLQVQSRKLRDHQKQACSIDAPRVIELNEYEPPQLQNFGAIPRELKYLVNPRGPPLYGRDADVPLAEQTAPASLLERLRYSIAPRGPSLVTVTMQSPECQFFSGPRESSEDLQFQMAG